MDGAGVAFEATSHHHNNQVLKVLGALKEASHQLQRAASPDSSTSSVKALLELEFASNSILSSDRQLSALSSHLSDLKTLIRTQENSGKPEKQGISITSFLTNRVRNYEISRVANSIESEIQAWIDRENIANLAKTLEKWKKNSGPNEVEEEETLLTQLTQFRNRLSQGFDIDLQNTLLKSRLLPELESLLCRMEVPKRVREMVAYSLKEAVLFNKDVFIGELRVGQIIKALASMGSLCSLEVLKSLIKAIKSPLVDELESCGGIMKIINALDSPDLGTKIRAIDCVMEIGYYGRKEAIEAMLNGGLIKKLMHIQRCVSESHEYPFGSCVARFAVQLEVGEGLRQREKRAFKQEILKSIREASVSDAEAATVIAEVLWGSSP